VLIFVSELVAHFLGVKCSLSLLLFSRLDLLFYLYLVNEPCSYIFL
jgi:hypothetical protein